MTLVLYPMYVFCVYFQNNEILRGQIVKNQIIIYTSLQHIILTGCASNTLIKGPLIRDHQNFQLKLKHPEINFSDEEILTDYFSQSKLKTEDGRKKLTQNIIAFLKLKQGLSQGQIIVPPKTTVRILISSFCAFTQ